jgi:hypothetical protein
LRPSTLFNGFSLRLQSKRQITAAVQNASA